jgi:ParB/RepB/Spo0J family partition protein
MSQQVTVRNIPIGQLSISKFNVRKKVGDLSELVLSVRSVGVLEPVIARPVGKNFEIIIGSRRFAAAKKAGLKTVPTIVKTLSDDEALVESLTENLQRGDLEEEEIVAAYNMLHAFDPKRWTQQKFADKMGKSQQWVNNLLAAYQTLVKLKDAGLVKGMTSYPRGEERERGIAPVTHLTRIEEGVRSLVSTGGLSEKEGDKKREQLAKAVLDLPFDDAVRVIDRVKMYPEKPIQQLKEEALVAQAGVALKTYLPPTMARQIEERTGHSIEEGITQVIERGLESMPETGQEEKPPMKHWADELTQEPMSVQVGNWWKWNLDRIGGKFDFFTTHYSGKDVGTFAETLKANGVKTLIDIRDTPFSQFRPEFNKESLSKTLTGKGINYLHHPELGVPKEQRDKLAKTGNWSGLFGWYDNNVIPKLDSVLNSKSAPAKPVAFMCVEKDPQKCHRHRIALELESKKMKSLDI